MSSAYTFCADAGTVVDPPAEGILSRELYKDDDLKVVLMAFSPGQELSEHTASMPALLQVLRGDARLTLGTESVEAGPGAWVHMPAHLKHSVVAKSPLVILLHLLKSAA